MLRRQETSNEDSYLSAGRPSNLLRTSFSSAKLETLYRASSLRQRRGGLEYFLISVLLYGIQTLVVPVQDLPARGFTAVFLGLNLGLLAWIEHNQRAKDAFWSVVPHVAWQLTIAHLLGQLYFKTTDVTPGDALGWLLLMLYLLFATLPLRLSLCVLLAIATTVVYILTVVGLSKAPSQIPIDILVGVASRLDLSERSMHPPRDKRLRQKRSLNGAPSSVRDQAFRGVHPCVDRGKLENRGRRNHRGVFPRFRAFRKALWSRIVPTGSPKWGADRSSGSSPPCFSSRGVQERRVDRVGIYSGVNCPGTSPVGVAVNPESARNDPGHGE
ncbi:hypothetical protein WN48_04668 [Eufriesea mexicana]|uniref:Uncharacterized protein n=1 Tax=Eufriesea mexicana TaxID=516756 RepID=A0A310SQA3_9HYME|nr:hypothetical protein WN48_04668 [Eufriesea mexicana]